MRPKAKNTMSFASLKLMLAAKLTMSAADEMTKQYVRACISRAPNKKWLQQRLTKTTWLFTDRDFLHS